MANARDIAIPTEFVTQVTPAGARRLGLVVGIDSYADSGIPNLKAAIADARAMHALMVDPACGLFDPEHTQVLIDADATRSAIERALERLRRAATPDDEVWIYFAGHGVIHEGTHRLIPADGEREYLDSTSVQFAQYAAKIRCRRKIVFLDCCHSGASDASTRDIHSVDSLLRSYDASGTITFCSSDGHEKSVELPDVGRGAFSYWLERGLRGEADANGDGVVTSTELWEFVRRNVEREAMQRTGARQTPRVKLDASGAFALSVSRDGVSRMSKRKTEVEECMKALRTLMGEDEELHLGSDQLRSARRLLESDDSNESVRRAAATIRRAASMVRDDPSAGEIAVALVRDAVRRSSGESARPATPQPSAQAPSTAPSPIPSHAETARAIEAIRRLARGVERPAQSCENPFTGETFEVTRKSSDWLTEIELHTAIETLRSGSASARSRLMAAARIVDRHGIAVREAEFAVECVRRVNLASASQAGHAAPLFGPLLESEALDIRIRIALGLGEWTSLRIAAGALDDPSRRVILQSAQAGDPESMLRASLMLEDDAESAGATDGSAPGPLASSIEWLQRAAARGQLEAICLLANRFDCGDGVAENKTEALRLFKLAADRGHAGAQWSLGHFHYGGEVVAQDLHEAVRWFKLSAEQGHVDAQAMMGVCLDNGQGVVQDEAAARLWHQKAAEQGSASAQFNLGQSLATGTGGPQDLCAAVSWYRKAADQGDEHAQLALANCYYDGLGVAQDFGEAVRWYREAADLFNADAQYMLGECFRFGNGVEKDETKAVRWFTEAAEQGDADAQFKLGFCFQNGIGVEQDEKTAAHWYKEAAEQDHVDAQVALGDIYAQALGVPKDPRKAAAWYRRACEGEESEERAEAYLRFGLCCLRGFGVTTDRNRAAKWLRRAAEAGSDDAKCELEALRHQTGETARKDSRPKPASLPQASSQDSRSERRSVWQQMKDEFAAGARGERTWTGAPRQPESDHQDVAWYWSDDGQQRGPIGLAQLRELAASGTIVSSTWVFGPGFTDWCRGDAVQGLLNSVASDRSNDLITAAGESHVRKVEPVRSQQFAALVKKYGSGTADFRTPVLECLRPTEPLAVLLTNYLLWESTPQMAAVALERIARVIVDVNDLRVMLKREVVFTIGDKYPFVEERTQRLRSTLSDIFRRQHRTSLDHLRTVSREEQRAYLEGLAEIPPFVVGRTLLVAFELPAPIIDDTTVELLHQQGIVEDRATTEEVVQWIGRHHRLDELPHIHVALTRLAEEAWSKAGPQGTRIRKSYLDRQAKFRETEGAAFRRIEDA